MKPQTLKKLIVSLITDDLIHTKLTDGLENLGFNPDAYSLYLSETILELMGFREGQSELMFQYYDEMKKRASAIDNSANNKAMKQLAHDIYQILHLQCHSSRK